MALLTRTPILYILMRTDLASLNPGKGMAQAAHAANCAVAQAANGFLFNWEQQTSQSFGTTIVLDGGSMDDIKGILSEIEAKNGLINDTDFSCGVIHDPTYPVRDGNVTHLIPLDTCAYVFCMTDSETTKILSRLNLHA